MGNAHQNVVPYQVFETAPNPKGERDHMILAVGNDGQFAKFCAVAGHPEWASDPRFAKNADRVRNRAVLVPMLEDTFKTRSKAQWLAELEQQQVPAGPINNLAEVFTDPQVRERDMVSPWQHSVGTPFELVSSPMKLSRTPVRRDLPPPTMGQHTSEILREVLGYNDAQINELRSARVI
jgi:crotonobetainyl-CoA:carnitine CoA-transferase CaiB-like acyl-CoA transferase